MQLTLQQILGNPEEDELLWEWIGSMDLERPLTVHPMTVQALKQLKAPNGEDILTVFRSASPEQKKLVAQYSRRDLSREIIVKHGDSLLDGFHRVVAAILSNQDLNAVDLQEWDNSSIESKTADYGTHREDGKPPKGQIGAPKTVFPGDTVVNNDMGANEPFGTEQGVNSPPASRGEYTGPRAPAGPGVPIDPTHPSSNDDSTTKKDKTPPQYRVSTMISHRPMKRRENSKDLATSIPNDLRDRYADLSKRIREISDGLDFDLMDIYKYRTSPPKEWVEEARRSVAADWDDERSWKTYSKHLKHDDVANLMAWDEVTAAVSSPGLYQKYVESDTRDPFDFWFRRKKPSLSDDPTLVSRVRRRLRHEPESDIAQKYSDYWRKRNLGLSLKRAYQTAKEKWLNYVKEHGGEFVDPTYQEAVATLKDAQKGYVPTEQILMALETIPFENKDRVLHLRSEYESLLKDGVHTLDITAGSVARDDRLFGHVQDLGLKQVPVRRIAGEYEIDSVQPLDLSGVDWTKTFDEQFIPAAEEVEVALEEPTEGDVTEVLTPSSEEGERFVVADDLIDVALTAGQFSTLTHAQRMAEILPHEMAPKHLILPIDPEEAKARLKSRRGLELPAPGVFASDSYQTVYHAAPLLPLDPNDPSSVQKCLDILEKSPGAMVSAAQGEPSQYYRFPTRFGDKRVEHIIYAAWFAINSANTAVEAEEVQFVVWQSGQAGTEPGQPGLMARKPKIIDLLRFLQWAGFPKFEKLYSILREFSPTNEDYEHRLLALTRQPGFQAKVASFFLALLGDKRSPTLDMHAHGYLIEKGKIQLPTGKVWTPLEKIRALNAHKETRQQARDLAKKNKSIILWVMGQYNILRTEEEASTGSKKVLETEKKRIRLYMQRQLEGWNGNSNEFWQWYANNQFFDTHEPRRDMIHTVFFQSLFPELFTSDQLAKKEKLYRDYQDNLQEIQQIQFPEKTPTIALYQYGDRFFLKDETPRLVATLRKIRETGLSYVEARVIQVIPGSSLLKREANLNVWRNKTKALRSAIADIQNGHSREAVFLKYGGEYGPGLPQAVNDYLWLKGSGREHCASFVEQSADNCGGCTFNPNGGGNVEYGYGEGACLLSDLFLNAPEKGFGKMPPEAYTSGPNIGTPRTQKPVTNRTPSVKNPL